MTGVAGSVPVFQPFTQAVPRTTRPVTTLVIGPAIAIQNSDLASEASVSVYDTPPKANRVIARTRRPRAFAKRECASSWSRRAAKNNRLVTTAAIHTTMLLH